MAKADGVGVVRFIRETADGEPDAELVRRFAADSDPQAFRALVARHGPVVWSVCRRLVRNHHDAEDVFQATFLVLARGAGGIRNTCAVGGWLCGVAARVSARVRSANRSPVAEVEPATGHPDGALGDLTIREAEAALYEELARLPERYRSPLVLCCLEGLSRDEAAARLGWSANRVKHNLEQGRQLLRTRLARRGIALGLPLLTSLLTPATAAAVPPAVAESVVRYATSDAPPAALSSLAHGVRRTMWIAKWKWAAAACAALVLATGGTLAAVLSQSPEVPAAPAKVARNLVLVDASAEVPKVQAVKNEPKAAWEVASEFLQLVIDKKGEQALKLADPRVTAERHIKELQTAGLKRVKLAMVLINDKQAMVVTERAKLVRRPGADAEDAHATVELGREKPDAPWVVRDSNIADEGRVWREADNYFEGKYNFKPDEALKQEPNPPKAPWDAGAEFLKLALAGKTADALKLTVPGTVSENKVGEIKKAGFTGQKVVGVLLNDTRMEVVGEQHKNITTGGKRIGDGHLVLMLTRSKDGAWQVKDIDFRDQKELEPRVKLYLEGNYDEKK